MALSIPVVLGPVNELMQLVCVQGGLPGATVTVSDETTRQVVAKGVAGGSGRDDLPLLGGATLAGGARLVGHQEWNGDSSPAVPTSLAVTVGPAPAPGDLGFVGSRSHLYTCGTHLWLTGAYPGAEAEVEWGGAVQGSAIANSDGARVALASGLPAGPVTIRQRIPAGAGPSANLNPDALPSPGGRQLPPPKINPPVIGCQTAVLVTDVFDGATVTLARSGGPAETAGFDMSGLWFGLARELEKGEKIHATQDFLRCERQGGQSPDAIVGDPAGVPAPQIVGPLCVGAASVRVVNGVPGALVHLSVGNQTFTGMVPQSADFADIFVGSLGAGNASAKQELCSVTSPASASVAVQTEPPVTPVTLPDPLFACGRTVHVTHAHPGAVLQVWADHGGSKAPISALTVVTAAEITVPVNPYLRPGDKVWVEEFGCADSASVSAEMPVQPPAVPAAPDVAAPVYSGTSVVTVKGVVPGALVEVYVAAAGTETWQFAGSTLAGTGTPVVGLNRVLRLRDMVRARQTICANQTQLGAIATVVVPPPSTPTNLSPANGSTGVGTKPTFTWKDGAIGTDGAATGYEVQLKDGGTTVVGLTAVGGPSWTPANDLGYSQPLTFQVRAVNASGKSDFAQTVVTTKPKPQPVAPTLTSYDVSTKTLKGQGFLASHAVYVRLSMVGNTVINSYGQGVPDTRDRLGIAATSDSSGAISVVVNPQTVLPALVLDDQIYLAGAASGEQLHFSANDARPNPADATGTLWSNTLTITAP